MPFANTEPLRRELATALPKRGFTVRFWDGTELPATDHQRQRLEPMETSIAGRSSRCARPRRSPTSCAHLASSGSAGLMSPASWRSTTSTV